MVHRVNIVCKFKNIFFISQVSTFLSHCVMYLRLLRLDPFFLPGEKSLDLSDPPDLLVSKRRDGYQRSSVGDASQKLTYFGLG